MLLNKKQSWSRAPGSPHRPHLYLATRAGDSDRRREKIATKKKKKTARQFRTTRFVDCGRKVEDLKRTQKKREQQENSAQKGPRPRM